MTIDNGCALMSLSPNVLDQYAGQWVAQVGSEVIASARTVVELLEGMPSTDSRPTIWRLPVNDAAAASTTLGL